MTEIPAVSGNSTGASGATFTVNQPQSPAAISADQPQSTSSPRIPVSSYTAELFAVRELRDYTQHLVGGVLTVLEAAGLPKTQFDALRKLVFRECWDEHYGRALAWAERIVAIQGEQTDPGQNVWLPPFPFSVSSNSPE